MSPAYEKPLLRLLRIAGIALIGSFAIALVYVHVFHWMLPPDDGAYGQPPLADRLTRQAMIFGAVLSWIVVAPCAFVLLWNADLMRSTLLTFAVATFASAIATWIRPKYGWPASLIATILALAFCRLRFTKPRATTAISPPPPPHS